MMLWCIMDFSSRGRGEGWSFGKGIDLMQDLEERAAAPPFDWKILFRACFFQRFLDAGCKEGRV